MTGKNDHNNPGQVRQLYRHLARIYDVLDSWWAKVQYRKAYLALNRAFEAHLPPNGRILDLGCGTGLNVERLQALELPFDSYLGVDFSEDMLAKAKAKHGRLERIRFRQMDLSRDPLPEGPFDLVISTWVFEHLPDPVSVVEKAWQQLVPGGYLVLLFMMKKGWVNLWGERVLKLWNANMSYGVEEDVSCRLPGIVSLDHFGGGTAAVAVLHKAEKEIRHG